MWVKICGITSESDALLAVAMGADALGFVFAPSARQVSVRLVDDIIRRLPPEVLTVGVFRDEHPDRVIEIARTAGLGAVQLHGRESVDATHQVHASVPVVIKAFAAGSDDLHRADEFGANMILVDGATPGSGTAFDWSLMDAVSADTHLILAGGLAPDNVTAAIRRVQPWGVDVSSGVESAPGRKDARKLKAFIEAARSVTFAQDPKPSRHGDLFDWSVDT
jgi:phosphoribosylanthranilate isomerase